MYKKSYQKRWLKDFLKFYSSYVLALLTDVTVVFLSLLWNAKSAKNSSVGFENDILVF